MISLKRHSSELLKHMEKDLNDIRVQYPETWDWSKASLDTVAVNLTKLKDYTLQHPFKRRSEEVFFFRKIKPLFLSKLIFFSEVWNIESGKLTHSMNADTLSSYLWTELNKIEEFFISNSFLYEYYKGQQDYMDFKLFVRKPDNRFRYRNIPLKVPPFLFYGDPEFSTGYDFLFSQFGAYELLRVHLIHEYEKTALLSGGGENDPGTCVTGNGFENALHLLAKLLKPLASELSQQDIITILYACSPCALSGHPGECIMTREPGKTGYLPDRLKTVMSELYKQWQSEIEDIEY